MARPRKEGMDYFPHDVHMSTDKKVKALRILYGNDGYAFFNIALEMIYQEPNFELDVSDAETLQILASNVEVTPQKLSEMIGTAIKHGCFDRERYMNDGVLTSNGIQKRAEVVTKKRVTMREKYDKKVSDAETKEETKEETPQSKSKRKVKDKVKDIDKTLYGEHVLLTPEQFEKLNADLSTPVVAKLIDDINYWFTQKPSRKKDYSEHNLMIRNWHKKNLERQRPTGGERNAEYGRGPQGVRPGGNQTQSGSSEGESKRYPSRWADVDVPMPKVSG